MSIFQPVSFAARRTFWPLLPIASDNCASGTLTLQALGSSEITSTEVYWAIKEHVDLILTGVKEVFASLSPELSADVYESGIVLTGKGSLLYGTDAFLESATGVPVRRAKDPWLCVAKGLGKSLHNIKKLKKNGYEFKYRDEF